MAPWFQDTGVLPYISQYHQLRVQKEFGLLSARQAWEMTTLRELLEPRSHTAEGLVHTPLRLPVQREALVLTAVNKLPARVEVLGLRQVELKLSRRLPLGLSVRLAIAGPHRRTWYRFIGCVARVLPRSASVSVELEGFLGCEPMVHSIHTPAALEPRFVS